MFHSRKKRENKKMPARVAFIASVSPSYKDQLPFLNSCSFSERAHLIVRLAS